MAAMLARDVTVDKRSVVSFRPATSPGLLSVLTTNQTGLLAEAAVIHECVKLGIDVAGPLGDERYDLILDVGRACSACSASGPPSAARWSWPVSVRTAAGRMGAIGAGQEQPGCRDPLGYRLWIRR